MTRNYKIISEYLSSDPFFFLDDLVPKFTGVKVPSRNPNRSARLYQYLTDEIPVIFGIPFDATVTKTICVIVDNETGFHRVRENGFPMNDTQRKRVIALSWYLNKQTWTRNKVVANIKDATMESDFVKFRGTFWIQLTGRSNFEATGDTAYKIRKTLPVGNDVLKTIMSRHDKLSSMSSVEIDVMAMDPLMNLLVTFIFLSKSGSLSNLTLKDRIERVNDSTAVKMLSTIGYDNNPKPAKWGTVPSLNDMVHRVNNYIPLTNKLSFNEKSKVNSNSGARTSRQFKFTRSSRT